jgi:hypothetical protein
MKLGDSIYKFAELMILLKGQLDVKFCAYDRAGWLVLEYAKTPGTVSQALCRILECMALATVTSTLFFINPFSTREGVCKK